MFETPFWLLGVLHVSGRVIGRAGRHVRLPNRSVTPGQFF